MRASQTEHRILELISGKRKEFQDFNLLRINNCNVSLKISFWLRVIQNHQVNAILTAPTALRVIRREDPEALKGQKYSTRSLRNIFIAGEHCDHETKSWAAKVFQVEKS